MQNTKSCALLLLSLMIVGSLILSSTFSSLMSEHIIKSTGKISTTEVTAKSGSPEDIQAAVDTVEAAGGGIVYIPEGKFYWNNEIVTIPGGISVIGASPAGCKGHEENWELYTATTILHNNKVPPANNMFYVVGTNGELVRISGIQFEIEGPEGTDTDKEATAIRAYRCTNIRIDHCTFINFTSNAVKLTNTDTGTASGVIDHCVVDNPYKLGSGSWLWAYGFYVQGKATWWNDETAPLTDFLGKYSVKNGYPVLYVEDCKISRTRHAVDAIQGGWIVARYNYIDHPYPTHYGQLQVHGSGEGSWPSARGFEFYNNIVLGETGYFADLTWLRGGAGVVFANSFTMNSGYGIGLYKETCPQQPDEVLHDVWIWSNTMSGGTLLHNVGGFTEDVDYFLRSPNQALDGFTYTPYLYPHPLTSG